LLALFRAGNEEAFGAIHDRYRQRLFAYVRQMLSAGPRQDAEDVMQDVFVRAYGALRADDREVNLRAWLYRVAHNRCIDHLRRPTPPPAEIFEMSRKPLHDPIEEAQRREDLARLVEDVGRLPEQQRSALLMREMDGMSYADLAAALDVTVPAIKSLLVRARVGLVEAAEARDADCCEIRDDLMASYDRGVKASGRARKHMRSCSGCREYREALRGMRRSFAALTPVSAGLFGSIAASLGIGGGGAAAGGAAAGGGGVAATAAGGTLATATACKVAAVVCTAALTAGGAVEVNKLRNDRAAAPAKAAAAPAAARPAPAAKAVPVAEQPVLHRTMSQPVTPAAPKAAKEKVKAEKKAAVVVPLATGAPVKETAETTPVTAPETTAPTRTGGVSAPEQAEVPAQSPGTTAPGTTAPASGTPPQSGTAAPEAGTPSGSTGSGAQNGSGDPSAPPSEH
jgi:RNA polymerase sigma factor (sigma-70 family)